jgi:hypothetical protein
MKRIPLLLVLTLASLAPALAQKPANPFLGRWDLTITAANSTYPGWLEVTEQNGKVAATVQPRTGSVQRATGVKLEGSGLTLTVSEATPNRPAVVWQLAVQGDRITGSQKRGTAEDPVAGVRAPALDRPMPQAWTNPESLFNGKDLTGWEPDNPAANHWAAQNGALVNVSKGANIRTTRTFDDFKLHVEFNCPEDGNSGVYLRGRYELQVEYEPVGANDKFHIIGSIYGRIAPTVELPRKPGQWETYDVTLVGRRVTVIRDGVKIIDNQEIAGITGGALDSRESEPGPLYIQGDHTGGMKYRNITISVPRK